MRTALVRCGRKPLAWNVDSRISVAIAADLAALDLALAEATPAAVLAEAPAPPRPDAAVAMADFGPVGLHASGCACCAGRVPAAVALDRLFQARVRGQCGWFDRVLALAPTPAGRAAVSAVLHGDALTAARFRLAG